MFCACEFLKCNTENQREFVVLFLYNRCSAQTLGSSLPSSSSQSLDVAADTSRLKNFDAASQGGWCPWPLFDKLLFFLAIILTCFDFFEIYRKHVRGCRGGVEGDDDYELAVRAPVTQTSIPRANVVS